MGNDEQHRPYLAGLLLTGRRVVAVGGGRVNARRVTALLDARAAVTVVAPALDPRLVALVDAGRIAWTPRNFTESDLDGAWYVLAATDSPEVNAAVVAAAEARHTFCVRADDGPAGSAWTPASAGLGDLTVGVVAGGNPGRAKGVRDRLVELLTAPPPGTAVAPGEVVLVGGGPGDPDLLTVGGLKALRAADVVLYDHLAPVASLAHCRPDAQVIDVGKLPDGPSTTQDEINRLLVEHAQAGRRVVRFKGGDSFVFGRGSEEVLACADAGVPVRVIPGVSSSIAGPELAGIPLTHRGLSQSFTVVSGHVGPEHLGSTTNWDALAATSGTLVILMGVKHLDAICAGLITRGKSPDTPAAIVAQAASASQRVVRGTLATLPALAAAASIKPPALTVIGDVVALDLDARGAECGRAL